MKELLRNAWLSWQQFTSAGKLMAILPAALLYFWMSGKQDRKRQNATLLSYTSVMAVCCILPVTVPLLMLYQTRFYDYLWVWSLVPMTAVAAWAGTELLHQYWEGFRWNQWRKGLPVSLLLLAVLALCSGMGNIGFDRTEESQRRIEAKQVLTELIEQTEGGLEDILLWAPREVIEYAREFDGAFMLLYGRDMWDASLGAYTYDTYSLEVQNLYLWMENVDESGLAVVDFPVQGEVILQGRDCMASAVKLGVDCILLPSRIEVKEAEALARIMGGSAVLQGDYYVLNSHARNTLHPSE